MKAGVIAAIIAVLVVIGGIFALTRKKASAPAPTTSNTTTSTSNSTPTQSTTPPANVDKGTQSAQNTITYSNNGFSPATLTVKSGDSVTIKNDSSRLLQFDSDPHPAHTDDPELNVGTISPGQSKTITVTTTGSHGYHNHLNDSDRGTLVVQ